ncbi:hypothetical protein LY76DRAFT_41932 [Colletotrichum caudatum]|nr:hypothetical protein LY76DRAFT_41932 [Colletotrichum caudatum]
MAELVFFFFSSFFFAASILDQSSLFCENPPQAMTPPTRAGRGTISCSVCPPKLREVNGPPFRRPHTQHISAEASGAFFRVFPLFLLLCGPWGGGGVYLLRRAAVYPWSSVRPLTRPVVIRRGNPWSDWVVSEHDASQEM